MQADYCLKISMHHFVYTKSSNLLVVEFGFSMTPYYNSNKQWYLHYVCFGHLSIAMSVGFPFQVACAAL